jgi:carbonic anhydrase/acetyltransferase-like protein (isoleucine patch superfamily)
VGQVNFHTRAALVAHHLGRSNVIRGDGGQPVNFAGFPDTGAFVSVDAPVGNRVTIGTGLQAANNAVLVADFTKNLVVGNNVTVGPGAVISGSTIGNDVTIGARAYVSESTLANGTIIPDGTIMVSNKVLGKIQW